MFVDTEMPPPPPPMFVSPMDFELPPEILPETAKYTLRALVLQGSDIPVFKFPNAQVIYSLENRYQNHTNSSNRRLHLSSESTYWAWLQNNVPVTCVVLMVYFSAYPAALQCLYNKKPARLVLRSPPPKNYAGIGLQTDSATCDASARTILFCAAGVT